MAPADDGNGMRQRFGPGIGAGQPRLRWVVALLALGGVLVLAQDAVMLPVARGSAAFDVRGVDFLGLLVSAPLMVLVPLAWWQFGLSVLRRGWGHWPWRLATAALCLATGLYLPWRANLEYGRAVAARAAAFPALAQRAEPLLAALRAYQRDQGRSAPSLAALVPRYLSEVPGTDLLGYPRWHYAPDNTSEWRYALAGGGELVIWFDNGVQAGHHVEGRAGQPAARFSWSAWRHQPTVEQALAYCAMRWDGGDEDNLRRLLGPPTRRGTPPAGAWCLWVDCGFGLMNWDQFYYLPTESYPAAARGGYVERMGAWGYVHE